MSAGDYPACTSSTRGVWTSGWPPAGNAPSAEWTLRPNWPLTVDSSCRLLQLWIWVLLILHCLPPGGGGRLCQTPPLPPLHHSTSLPFWDSCDRGINKAHSPTTQRGMGVDAFARWLDWRLVEWTCWMSKVGADVYGQMCWGFTWFCQIVHPVYISPYSHRERTLWPPTSPAQCGELRPFLCHYI